MKRVHGHALTGVRVQKVQKGQRVAVDALSAVGIGIEDRGTPDGAVAGG